MTGRSTQTPQVNQKSVLIVEDQPSVRGSLAKSLKQYGFRADTADGLRQAQKIIQSSAYSYDVAVLDILLEDEEEYQATGIDLGRALRKAQPELPPELVIFSGNYDRKFYSNAIDLEVSEFIAKDERLPVKTIATRIGTWALRRSINPVRKEIGQRIEEIAQQDLETTVAIKLLCSEVIKPEVDATLHVPTVFLLSDRKGTQNVIADPGLPADYHDVYTRIQDATFKKNGDGPFAFSSDLLQNVEANPEFHKRLSGSSFIHLHEEGDLRLSLGILKLEQADKFAGESDPQKLATLLEERFRPPVMKLLRYLARIEAAVGRAERKTLLDYTSRFCMYVGQTQLEVLAEAVENNEIEPNNKCFQRLRRLAHDLNATGNEFSQLTVSSTPQPADPKVQVSAQSVMGKCWEMIEEQQLAENLGIKQEGDDVKLPIAQEDLFVAVLRLLQWMAQRHDRMPGDVAEPHIHVAYSSDGDRREIRITDQSRRLSAPLRRRLFDPFALGGSILEAGLSDADRKEHNGLYLPLYLAKTLIETKNYGKLQDKTNELNDPLGHCFVISFEVPAGKKP